jgi:hypothetical protein
MECEDCVVGALKLAVEMIAKYGRYGALTGFLAG